MRTREIVIPLSADAEFLDSLTGALANLSEVQQTQKEAFVADVENLSSAIARAASPFASQNDLYTWREIFSLWMELEIFESARERDRGELSVDESETRLTRFAEELAKRGWTTETEQDVAARHSADKKGGRRLLRRKHANAPNSGSSTGLNDPSSVAALKDFMRINVALLDVKKFQRINVEAARKILKKHDKRTALTASDDLRSFIARGDALWGTREAATADIVFQAKPVSGRGTALVPATHPSLAALLPSSTTGMLSESLPHILLSLMATTLLPILPSIEEYECAICYSVAWRPIRLDCSHLFCIRCLVKLQKQGASDCPLCRAKGVVATADKSELRPNAYPGTRADLFVSAGNLDEAVANMLELWWAREVEEKAKENEQERRIEEAKELGLEFKPGCVIA